MAFILTNHSLSPRIRVNDPLVSGLSVTRSSIRAGGELPVLLPTAAVTAAGGRAPAP